MSTHFMLMSELLWDDGAPEHWVTNKSNPTSLTMQNALRAVRILTHAV